MKKKILVIGSEGLIGSNVCSHLDKKYLLFKIDKNLNNINKNISIDLSKEKNVKKIFDLFLKKKIHFSSIINTIYPKRAGFKMNFIDFDPKNFERDVFTHLLPFYYIFIYSYKYYEKLKKPGQVITLSSIYGLKIPNFKIYKNTNIKSPIAYSASKAAISIMSKYFSRWSTYNKINIKYTSLHPAGIVSDQSSTFKSNYRKIYKKKMLKPKIISFKIENIIKNPSKYNCKNVVITGGVNLKN